MMAVRVLDVPNEASSDDEVEVARRFYCECLGGRQLAQMPRVNGVRFVVAGVLVETGHVRRGATARVVLPVEDPEGVAASCWNAGYTVVVGEPGGTSTAAAIAILDPFGLRIDLERADQVRRRRCV